MFFTWASATKSCEVSGKDCLKIFLGLIVERVSYISKLVQKYIYIRPLKKEHFSRLPLSFSNKITKQAVKNGKEKILKKLQIDTFY